MTLAIKRLSLTLGVLYLASCSPKQPETPLAPPALIPLPAQMTLTQGQYVALPRLTTLSSEGDVPGLDNLQYLLERELGLSIERTESQGLIHLAPDASIQDLEGYRLQVTPESGIRLMASSGLGFIRGLFTLAQLTDSLGRVHAAEIEDAPRFPYRGLMLDVSRHFMSTDMIIRLLDEMARYKLNRFHWHLVDGGGWRMESKAYPLLTQKAAWRTQRDWDKWWHGRDRRFVDEGTPGSYGGYYTQQDIGRVVEHAERLGITIVPEIELPGHSTEVSAAYPELFCIGRWDESVTDVCIGSEATFTFFERILEETMALFPNSPMIHIGGDEAAMNHWGSCARCRARMRTEGLQDLHELQSYMIKRMERFLSSHGRTLVGWDEILLGGLAPGAVVMSWRGEAGGIAAAKAGHRVIMTPNNYLYLDYYQAEAKHQPRAIGGYVPLEQVYRYNPEPEQLSPQERQYILGVQANLWTEYIESQAQAEYMYFPRALALAELAWTPQSRRSYADFVGRATIQTQRLRDRGINAYPLNGLATEVKTDTAARAVALTLRPEQTGVDIRYTTDGTEPTSSSTLYTAPISCRDSALVVAKLFRGTAPLDSTSLRYRIDYHKALGKQITYARPWNERYPAAADRTLVDGIRATPTYLDGQWQGFTEPMDVTIDLGVVMPLRHILMRFMQEREQWVYMPRSVEVLVSTDGRHYQSLGVLSPKTDEHNPRPVFETFDFYPDLEARYVRVQAEIGRSPGHFIFVDEIVVH